MISEHDILVFLSKHNNGEYRSRDLLFTGFLKDHPEYIDNQQDIWGAIVACEAKGYIKNREHPSYFIYLTDDGRKLI